MAKHVSKARADRSGSRRRGLNAPQYPISINNYIPTLVNRVASAALKGASGEFAKRGLTVPKYRILLAVAEYDNIHFRELAELTSVERSTLSRLLDEMENAGALRRRADPEDSRSINVSLTASGRALLEGTTEWALEVERDILRGMSSAEVQLLRRLLVRMFDNVGKQAARSKTAAQGKRRRRRKSGTAADASAADRD